MVTLKRFEDWPERLIAYFVQSESNPFIQGVFDCGHFAAGAIIEITGVDLYVPFRGKYETVKGYLTILKDLGYDSVEQYVSAALPDVELQYARRGDIVMTVEGGFEALGVCDGQTSLFIRQGGGLARVQTKTCQKAWRVG